ncbi:MAG TPA: protein kinase [Thermoanaerobaculia bacterium]
MARYEIGEKLGAGGMGEVFRATDTTLGRTVAIKVLAADVAAHRFIHEARAASALNHPHIVQVYDVIDEPVRGIVMEYVDGETLRAAMPRRPLHVLTQVADALARAHSAGIVHRDLKPENIILTRDGNAKVLDFGLAKVVEAKPVSADTPTEILASTPGMLVGTPAYMAPEQIEGRTVDHRTDIFAFGCLLYEVASGQHPFRAPTALDTLHNIVHAEPKPLDDAGLDAIARRCIAKHPDERYGSMDAVATDLRAALASPARRPRRAYFIAALIGLALIAGLTAWLRQGTSEWSAVPKAERAENLDILRDPNRTGAPINFALRNADIQDVLRSIALLSGLNITTAPEVTGIVNAHFENVPWDTALEQFLDQNGLRYEVKGGVVVVSKK